KKRKSCSSWRRSPRRRKRPRRSRRRPLRRRRRLPRKRRRKRPPKSRPKRRPRNRRRKPRPGRKRKPRRPSAAASSSGLRRFFQEGSPENRGAFLFWPRVFPDGHWGRRRPSRNGEGKVSEGERDGKGGSKARRRNQVPLG